MKPSLSGPTLIVHAFIFMLGFILWTASAAVFDLNF
jgi:hypothetical protein